MLEHLTAAVLPEPLPLGITDTLVTLWYYFLIILGFSVVIFFHELGHFLAAKACGVRVDKFAIGFGRELFGFSLGETRYSFNILPLGGYVKMLGQEDFTTDKSGELMVRDDPRAFTNKSVGQRMFIVSAGVIMNVLFAAAVFMVVFMLGMKSLPAEIGWIDPGSPAEMVGLRVGDRITAINGRPISDQSDLRAAVMLSDPDRPLKVTFLRKDLVSGEERTETVTIQPEMNPEHRILRIGVAPPLNNIVAAVTPEPLLSEDEQLRVGDEILSVNGRPVENFFDLLFILADLRGAFGEVKVRRPRWTGEDPSTRPADVPADEIAVRWRAPLTIAPEGRGPGFPPHLLGLVPRLRVTEVTPGSRAEQAGIRPGDIIARWGHQISPRVDEVVASIEANPETDIPVQVMRYGRNATEIVSLTVRPRSGGWLGRKKPRVGISWQGHEIDRVVVADIVTELTLDNRPTPAARLKTVMPRGARIVRVNEHPVNSWDELAARFIELAGTEIRLSWILDGQDADAAPAGSGTMYIPHTLGTTFPLPGSRLITAIDGRTSVDIEVNGRARTYSVDSWMGAREILRQSVGRTVAVEFWDRVERRPIRQELAVTEEMVDPWVLRLNYQAGNVLTGLEYVTVRETNPFKAMMIGVRKTYHFIMQVYITMQRMIFTRSMDLDQISGPVGIIKTGSDLAAAGLPVLLYFLALLSANLAVINFLPLPIFDGGLFVFLIIEKIKGRPISLKVQVVTQVIGIFLIVGIFLFVTFQDIVKLAGWG